MSRSLGDMVAASVGCSQDAEIFDFTLESKDKFIIIASDGVWEFLTNEQVHFSNITPFNSLPRRCKL